MYMHVKKIYVNKYLFVVIFIFINESVIMCVYACYF